MLQPYLLSSVICCHGPAGPGFPLSSPALKVFLEFFSLCPFCSSPAWRVLEVLFLFQSDCAATLHTLHSRGLTPIHFILKP